MRIFPDVRVRILVMSSENISDVRDENISDVRVETY